MSAALLRKAGAAAGSLAGYALARYLDRDRWYPHVAIGGLVGAFFAEIIVHHQQTTHEQNHYPGESAAAPAGADFDQYD